jgi:hypothetical protein
LYDTHGGALFVGLDTCAPTLPQHTPSHSHELNQMAPVDVPPEIRQALVPSEYDAPVAFYVGVIDILQRWTIGKKLERLTKRAVRRAGISCSCRLLLQCCSHFTLKVVVAVRCSTYVFVVLLTRAPCCFCLQVMCLDGAGLSAIEPNEYRRRFNRRVVQVRGGWL